VKDVNNYEIIGVMQMRTDRKDERKDAWQSIREKYKAVENKEGATEVEIQEALRVKTEEKEAQYRKQFFEDYPEYAQQIESSEYLRNLPIKTILAPFYAHKYPPAPFSFDVDYLRPGEKIIPRDTKEVIFRLGKLIKQVFTILSVASFDYLVIKVLDIKPISKVCAVTCMTGIGVYTFIERHFQELPPEPKKDPYPLETIVREFKPICDSWWGPCYPNYREGPTKKELAKKEYGKECEALAEKWKSQSVDSSKERT
jgi:hypothetical protein